MTRPVQFSLCNVHSSTKDGIHCTLLWCEMELNTVGKDIPLLLRSEEKRGIMHELQKSPLTSSEYQLVFPLLNGTLMLNEEN